MHRHHERPLFIFVDAHHVGRCRKRDHPADVLFDHPDDQSRGYLLFGEVFPRRFHLDEEVQRGFPSVYQLDQVVEGLALFAKVVRTEVRNVAIPADLRQTSEGDRLTATPDKVELTHRRL